MPLTLAPESYSTMLSPNQLVNVTITGDQNKPKRIIRQQLFEEGTGPQLDEVNSPKDFAEKMFDKMMAVFIPHLGKAIGTLRRNDEIPPSVFQAWETIFTPGASSCEFMGCFKKNTSDSFSSKLLFQTSSAAVLRRIPVSP